MNSSASALAALKRMAKMAEAIRDRDGIIVKIEIGVKCVWVTMKKPGFDGAYKTVKQAISWYILEQSRYPVMLCEQHMMRMLQVIKESDRAETENEPTSHNADRSVSNDPYSVRPLVPVWERGPSW